MSHLAPSVAFGLGVLLGGTFGGLVMALFAGRRVNHLERQVRWLRSVRYREHIGQTHRSGTWGKL